MKIPIFVLADGNRRISQLVLTHLVECDSDYFKGEYMMYAPLHFFFLFHILTKNTNDNTHPLQLVDQLFLFIMTTQVAVIYLDKKMVIDIMGFPNLVNQKSFFLVIFAHNLQVDCLAWLVFTRDCW